MQTPYQDNAYRVLGLQADATRKSVHEAAQRLRLKLRLGAVEAEPDPLAWLYGPLVLTPGAIDNALRCLENPQRRIRERLFWFSGRSSQQSIALSKTANQARVSHAACHVLGADGDRPELWGNSLAQWSALDLPEFWAAMADMESAAKFEPAASAEEFGVLRQALFSMLVDRLRQVFEAALERGDGQTVAGYLKALQKSSFPEPVVLKHLARWYLPAVKKTTELLCAAESPSAEKTHQSLFAQDGVLARLHTLLDGAPAQLESVRTLRIAAINVLWKCAKELARYPTTLSQAAACMGEAKRFAGGMIIEMRLEEDFMSIAKKAKAAAAPKPSETKHIEVDIASATTITHDAVPFAAEIKKREARFREHLDSNVFAFSLFFVVILGAIFPERHLVAFLCVFGVAAFFAWKAELPLQSVFALGWGPMLVAMVALGLWSANDYSDVRSAARLTESIQDYQKAADELAGDIKIVLTSRDELRRTFAASLEVVGDRDCVGTDLWKAERDRIPHLRKAHHETGEQLKQGLEKLRAYIRFLASDRGHLTLLQSNNTLLLEAEYPVSAWLTEAELDLEAAVPTLVHSAFKRSCPRSPRRLSAPTRSQVKTSNRFSVYAAPDVFDQVAEDTADDAADDSESDSESENESDEYETE